MKDRTFFADYIRVFLTQNSKVNLISKNDEKVLWEKHIFDSLSIEKFFEKYGKNYRTMLDIGTGGGFPSVPVALVNPELIVFALDSIRKKINAIENIKSELNIKNLYTICDRAENLTQKYDIVTSRAVAPLKVIAGYASPLLNKGGYFIAYKSKKSEEEIADSVSLLKKYHLKIVDIIDYNLPLEENFVRTLIILQKY